MIIIIDPNIEHSVFASLLFIAVASCQVEKQLYDAARDGRVSEVSSLLKDHPEIDVNWQGNTQWTALHAACRSGHTEVVKLLFSHPDINVNMKNSDVQTPLSLDCRRGQLSVVEVLL